MLADGMPWESGAFPPVFSALCQVLPGEGRPDRAALVRFGSTDEAKWIVERAGLAS